MIETCLLIKHLNEYVYIYDCIARKAHLILSTFKEYLFYVSWKKPLGLSLSLIMIV